MNTTKLSKQLIDVLSNNDNDNGINNDKDKNNFIYMKNIIYLNSILDFIFSKKNKIKIKKNISY